MGNVAGRDTARPGVQAHDPQLGTPVFAPLPASSQEQVRHAARSARKVFGPWAATPHAGRARVLRALSNALKAHADELVSVADRETALGEDRLRGEVGRTGMQLEMLAGYVEQGQHVDPVVSLADPWTARPDVRRMLRPVGPVAVFGASNFPLAFSVLGGDTASALAVGCPVLYKVHEAHPTTSRRVVEIAHQVFSSCGQPAELLWAVYGTPAGSELVTLPEIRAVGFTGSLAGGRALFDLCAARPDPIPFHGELGSINPVVVLPGAAQARPAELAAQYVASLTMGAGQFCTNPGLLFAPAGSAFLAHAAEALAKVEVGPLLTQRIADGYRDRLADHPWTDLPLVGRGRSRGAFGVLPEVRTTTLADFVARSGELGQERFGPAGLVVTYDRPEDLVQALSVLEGSLAGSIHADPDEISGAVPPVAAVLAEKVGRLVMNGWPTGVSVCWAMHHGGPWPATTNAAYTSVGAQATARWLVPIAYQDWPAELLPPELSDLARVRLQR